MCRGGISNGSRVSQRVGPSLLPTHLLRFSTRKLWHVHSAHRTERYSNMGSAYLYHLIPCTRKHLLILSIPRTQSSPPKPASPASSFPITAAANSTLHEAASKFSSKSSPPSANGTCSRIRSLRYMLMGA